MTTTTSLGPAPVEDTGNRWTPMVALMISVTLGILDFFIVNVALPDIQRSFGASGSAVEWLVAGYGLTFAVFLIAGGRVADRIGRRRVLAFGIAIFGVASLLCGIASAAQLLIAARFLQGFGAALVSPTVLSIIGVLYQGTDRRRALGIFGLVMGLAAVGGQLVGGLLIKADLFGLGWRTIFLINLPLAAIVLILLPGTVPETRSPVRQRVDIVGLVGIALGLGALLLPLVEGRQQGWPLWSWICLAASVLIFIGVGVQQSRLGLRGGAALFPPAAFAARPVRVGLLCMLIYVCNQAPLFLFLALYLQQGRGMSPIASGLTFSILAGGYLATSLKAPQLVHRFGRPVVTVSAALLVIGYLLLGWQLLAHGVGGPVLALAPGLLLVGLGQGIGLNAITTLVLSGAEPEHVGAVSGVMATVQQVGSAIGVAVIGLIFFGLADHGLAVALTVTVLTLAGLMVIMAGLARLLPRP
ncbi:MFS transporter [Microlunatus elymi]|uniref:MFS transporter n=1 Tax=Microlunatus elymi TaxID=2596828 RepID=A0A516PZ35_9ACTN|nr:MFS transporter [Microlunatus elymi]QDP96417.1 MFS transporter [Microlunatus elymi]